MGTDPTNDLRLALHTLEQLPDPTQGTMSEVAQRLDVAQQIQQVLADLTDALQMEVAERMETDSQVIAGIGQFTRRAKQSSTWRDDTSRERMFDDVKRALAQKVARDPMTGEILPPLVMVARETFDLIEACFSLGADPKAGFRKSLGLQPDEYRSKSTSGYSIKIDRGVEG